MQRAGESPAWSQWQAFTMAGLSIYQLPSEESMEHTKDSDCTVSEETLCCIECGVMHDEEGCYDCGGRGFHKPTCPIILAYNEILNAEAA